MAIPEISQMVAATSGDKTDNIPNFVTQQHTGWFPDHGDRCNSQHILNGKRRAQSDPPSLSFQNCPALTTSPMCRAQDHRQGLQQLEARLNTCKKANYQP